MNNFEEFDQALQNDVISLLLWDKTFLCLVRDSIPSEFFTSSIVGTICDICYDFYDNFQDTPKEHIFTEIETFCKRARINEGEKQLYETYIKKIFDYNPNNQYVLKRLSTAIENHAVKHALLKGAKLVKNGDIKKAKELILESFNAGLKDFQLGIDYSNANYTRTKEDDNVLLTMIEELDSEIALNGGFKRKMFSIWLGASNVGKSWVLCYLAKCAIVQGVNAVYYTIGDDDADGIKYRIDSSLAGPSNTNPDNIKIFDFDGIQLEDLQLRNQDERKALLKANKKSYLGSDKRGNKRSNIWIKDYASGECTPETIDAHLTQLSIREKFYPDIIFVDYIDELVSSKNSKDERVNQLDVINKLKAIGTNRNIHVCTASQTNRLSIDVPVLSARHIAEDIRKWQRADVVLGLCQTERERERGVMRINMIKNRHGRKEGQIEITQCYSLGQFCLSSRWVVVDQQ